MNQKSNIPKIVKEISLHDIDRIDVSLEGDWSPNVVTVWSRKKGFFGFSGITCSHPTFKPSLELYFKNSWLGIHCFRKAGDQNVFDEEFALDIVKYIEKRLKPERFF